MLKASLRVAFVGLMVSCAFAACGNDGDKDPVVTQPPPPPPPPAPNPTAFTFGNACAANADCGPDGACLTFGTGTTAMCSGPCRQESQTSEAEIDASWGLCADNQTGNLGATAACVAGDGAGQVFCAAICGTATTIATGETTDFGVCDGGFTCLIGAFTSSETADLSQLGVCS
ncbi:MAG: hypothetical protein IPL79_17890 [Myxococcales bacterium]|nr:hypothetical protein [Myxococcales bacterium]